MSRNFVTKPGNNIKTTLGEESMQSDYLVKTVGMF